MSFSFGRDGSGWCCGSSLPWLGLSSFSETVVELAVDHLQMAKAPRSRGATTDRLFGPLVSPLPLGRVAARSAFMLLDVIGRSAASPAQSMSLVVLLTKTCCSLRHFSYLNFKQIETTQL
jgi:hypothetical protein